MNIINLNKIFANYSTSLFGQTLFTFNKGIKVRDWEKQAKKRKKKYFSTQDLGKTGFLYERKKEKMNLNPLSDIIQNHLFETCHR